MSSIKKVTKHITLWLLPFVLFGCALVPAKKEVALEAPPSAEEMQAQQQLAMAEQAIVLEGKELRWKRIIT